jgi:flagellin-like protein
MGCAIRTAAEDRFMRGPYGIVGVIVTLLVIFVLLRLLGIV